MTTDMLQVLSFSYDDAAVRVIMIDDQPWWVATDLAAILGYRHVPHMIRMLDEDQKGVHLVDTLGGKQNMTIVTEGGLYRCIFNSKRPEAVAFRRWVENVLLPTLRRTGTFALAGFAAERQIGISPLLLRPEYATPEARDANRAFVAENRRVAEMKGEAAAHAHWLEAGRPNLDALVLTHNTAPVPNAAVEEKAMATVSLWADDAGVTTSGSVTIQKFDLWQDYQAWANQHDMRWMEPPTFYKMVRERFGVESRGNAYPLSIGRVSIFG